MGIEDRDYMREQPATGAPKILGIPRTQFFIYAAILIAFVVWKSGVFGKMSSAKPPKPTGPVNVNTATLEELRSLPDVDGKIADDIIKRRPFKKVDDLLEVKGIGAKKLEKLRDKVKIE